MKKLTFYTITALLLLSFIPTELSAKAIPAVVSSTTTNSVASAEAATYLTRLNEINAMDKSALSSPKKKLLRKEVISIKSHLQALGGGIYISVGAIIIILLLLLILF